MFTSSDIKSLQEAYQAVYDDELRSEIVEDDDLFEDLEIIDELSDEELDEIVEEIVYEMLDEGYDIDDVEYIFEDVLVERRLSSKEQKQRKERNKAANQASQKASRESAGRARRKRIGDAVKGALSKAGEMTRSARDYVMKKGGEAKQEINFRSSNAVNRAKAAATRAAMIGTGVSPMDVPTKEGGKRQRADNFALMTPSVRKTARQAVRKSIGDKWRSAKSAVTGAPGAAKSGLKGMIRRGAERVQRGAERLAKRMSEEVETFDIVLDFLLSEGIVETLEDAQWVMVNELDSEDIDAILEAYEIDEAQIMSVSGKDGSKYKINRNIERAQNAASRAKQRNKEREERSRNTTNANRYDQALRSSISRLNAKPGEDSGDYDSGYYGDDDTSGGTRHYSLSRTSRSNRRTRESGR